MRKKLVGIIVSVLSACLLFGCTLPYKGYTGEYPQLFTVAVNSIPNAKGLIHSEICHQPVVCLVEEDPQGRLLFCYCEGNRDEAQIYLMVCQNADEEYACYYEDAYVFTNVSNAINRIHHGGTKYPSGIDFPLLDFTDEQIATVKEQNDWGKELSPEKCAKAPIIRKVEK